jgi:two-component system, NarL family, nitrate/nitrite response regulator NarL
MNIRPANPIRILFVEDHAVVRAGLRLLIEHYPHLCCVGEAAESASAIDLAARAEPDIILLDLDLGAERGLDLIPALLVAAPRARILILTGIRDSYEHQQAIYRGAVGLVHKEQAPDVLLRVIEKVHAGEVWLERSMMANVISEMVAHKGKANGTELHALTDREREVISLVGEGLKNKQIGDRLSISEITVRHHLTSIFSKLGVESRLEMVLFAHRHGLTSMHSH